MGRTAIARWGEEMAQRFLSERGLSPIERNWSTREGELDLVMREGEVIVFVEVKARTSDLFGSPEEALTSRKRGRLLKAAWAYLEAHDLMDREWRLDFVAIEGTKDGHMKRIDHYPNVLEAGEGSR